MWKICMIWDENECCLELTVFIFSALLKYCATIGPISLDCRSSCVRLCNKYQRWISMSWKNVVLSWLYWSLMLHSDIVHLQVQFHWIVGRVAWDSVINIKDEYDMSWNEWCLELTALIFNALLRYCAPASPISLKLRLSSVSVYNKCEAWTWYEIRLMLFRADCIDL